MLRAWGGEARLGGLRRFAVAITILNVLGHTWFGFEQAWAVPFVAVGTAYAVELLLEMVAAVASRRPLRFSGGWRRLVDFLLSAHITGLAVGMLLYANARLWPVAFAAAVAVGSKAVLRVRIGERSRHVMNPSNFGITVTLLLFPWIGIAPPYQFTEELASVGDWVLPAIIVCSGTFMNYRFTRRLPLIAAWLAGFVMQAAVRTLASDGAFIDTFRPALVPMTGLAFVLFTFYMVTDPATTPERPREQMAFGAIVAATYGALVWLHIVFDLFFALTITSIAFGVVPFLAARLKQPATESVAPAPALVERVL
jgi:Na+-translocating ferredoxin:NAD+ oxidoreductase RnfD subunit